jgi:diaminopropionate ammonia-lyase
MPHLQIEANPSADRSLAYGDAQRAVVNLSAHTDAAAAITSWPGYEPTPLHTLSGLARRHDVATIWYKDEGPRFGVGSFKALGGAYGVQRVVEEHVRHHTGGQGGPASRVTIGDLIAGKYRHVTSGLTVITATDGNHGRAVAWGAKVFGCNAVIYLPAAVTEEREAAIRAYGAETIRVAGNYDDAVRRAQSDADALGFTVVSDTSYPGYTDIPRYVMQGYTVMVAEILNQLAAGEKPTHMFLQAGVGAFAASVYGHLWETWGRDRPILTIVEPRSAACLLESARAGHRVVVGGTHQTIMAGLAAGEVSVEAWTILSSGADYFMTIDDGAAASTMRLLARPIAGDPSIVAGESAVAGLAGFLCFSRDSDTRQRLGLDRDSRVLVVGTEGPTDLEAYERIVRRRP